MNNKIFSFLDDYSCAKNNERKFTLAGDSSYFEFSVFTIKNIDIAKEVTC